MVGGWFQTKVAWHLSHPKSHDNMCKGARAWIRGVLVMWLVQGTWSHSQWTSGCSILSILHSKVICSSAWGQSELWLSMTGGVNGLLVLWIYFGSLHDDQAYICWMMSVVISYSWLCPWVGLWDSSQLKLDYAILLQEDVLVQQELMVLCSV